VLDESDSLGSFLDAIITKTKQLGNTTVTPISSPKSRECPSDDCSALSFTKGRTPVLLCHSLDQ
jgi:hypothetical protein